MVAPTVLPSRGFQQTTPNSNLLFHFRAQDRSLVTVDRLSTGTLTRASAGGLTDGRGQRTANALTDVRLVGPAADNQPRWGVSPAGVPHLLLEDTRTNLMPISNPSTAWQASSALSTGGETTVAPDGTLVNLLTDNSTSVAQLMVQDVEVASTVAIVTWYTKWNGSTFGSIHRMNHQDTSVGSRGVATWEFGSTGAMAVVSTGGGGTVVSGPTHIGNNWWKTSLQCIAISTGNDNQIEIFPTDAAVGTTGGDMFIAHIQVEDVASTGLFASSHVPTVSAAVTRAAETQSFPFLPVPQAMTLYLAFQDGNARSATAGLIGIESAGRGNPRIEIQVTSGGQYQVVHTTAAGSVNSSVTSTSTVGDLVELRVTIGSDGAVRIHQVVNGGAETSGTASGGLALGSAWSAQLVYLNSLGTGARNINKYRALKIAAGDTKTMQQMREAM